METDPPTREETLLACCQMKKNKAARLDSAITAESLQNGGDAMANIGVQQGVKQDPVKQNQNHADPILRSNQAGFRSGRSCAQQIQILRRIMEGFQDYQLPLTVTFIDFKKVFDSINWKAMFAVLRHYGIPEPLVNAIGALYNNSKSAVVVDGNISDSFEVSTGVLQGDVLAPFLFIILVDYLLKKATSDLDSGVVTHPRRIRCYPV